MRPIPKRLSASVLLSVLSIITIIILLPRSSVSSRLKNIQVFGNDRVWAWGEAKEGAPRAARLVVFGDSWADNEVDKRYEGKEGIRWTDVLCAEIRCSSHLNFARTQPISDYPSNPPTGALASNEILHKVLAKSQALAKKGSNTTLPDLAAQVQSFIKVPPPGDVFTETLFVVSTGFWDVYYASFDEFDKGAEAIDSSIQAVFDQLDLLYLHFKQNLNQNSSSEERNKTSDQKFRVIIPKLFDPTLLPGWLAQRPVPLLPSNIAEQQKNAVYLTKRWNLGLENKLGGWLNQIPSDQSRSSVNNETAIENTIQVEKDIFYYDLPVQLMDLILETTLEAASLSDGSGLGKGSTPFEDVYISCVADGGEYSQDSEDLEEVNGVLVCKDPQKYLWWNSWQPGPVANKNIGERIAKMVKKGDTLRTMWMTTGKLGF